MSSPSSEYMKLWNLHRKEYKRIWNHNQKHPENPLPLPKVGKLNIKAKLEGRPAYIPRAPKPKRLFYNHTILGEEKRRCCVEGCDWIDGKRKHNTSYDYGVYFPDGKYYCPIHAREYDKRGQRLTAPVDVLEMEKVESLASKE